MARQIRVGRTPLMTAFGLCVVLAAPVRAETTFVPPGTLAPSAAVEAPTPKSGSAVRLFAAQKLGADGVANEMPAPKPVTKPTVAKPKPRRTTPSPAALARAARCKDRGALGVSRTITLDTDVRHHYGQQQYKKQDDILRAGEVVLTFDDGPLRRHTKRVLAALEKHCTKATFFVVGRMAIADPDMLRKVAAAGHTIGHHSWSHLNQNRYSFERTIAEFELGLSAVETVIGKPTAPFFRFPYLADPSRMQRYLAQRNFGIFSIDIDSYDWRSKSASRVHSTIMRGLKRRGKGILLFHDIQNATASALDRLLSDIKASGFKIVHIESARPAVTLPEYDKEAAILLEKRSFRRRARPLRTAFRYQGSVANDKPRARRPKPAVSRPSSERQRTVRVQQRREADRAAAQRRTTRPSGPPALRPLREPRPVARPTTPSWRDSVFGTR